MKASQHNGSASRALITASFHINSVSIGVFIKNKCCGLIHGCSVLLKSISSFLGIFGSLLRLSTNEKKVESNAKHPRFNLPDVMVNRDELDLNPSTKPVIFGHKSQLDLEIEAMVGRCDVELDTNVEALSGSIRGSRCGKMGASSVGSSSHVSDSGIDVEGVSEEEGGDSLGVTDQKSLLVLEKSEDVCTDAEIESDGESIEVLLGHEEENFRGFISDGSDIDDAEVDDVEECSWGVGFNFGNLLTSDKNGAIEVEIDGLMPDSGDIKDIDSDVDSDVEAIDDDTVLISDEDAVLISDEEFDSLSDFTSGELPSHTQVMKEEAAALSRSSGSFGVSQLVRSITSSIR